MLAKFEGAVDGLRIVLAFVALFVAGPALVIISLGMGIGHLRGADSIALLGTANLAAGYALMLIHYRWKPRADDPLA
jgi:hypothetical protein